jgi:ABC-type dipeptide/oligopeptide/nickel transport system permease subunit
MLNADKILAFVVECPLRVDRRVVCCYVSRTGKGYWKGRALPNLGPPGEGGLMGTDSLGSDVFSRVAYGARIPLESSLISVGKALLVGVPVGLTSGYYRGCWDEWVVMRIVDSLQAFPFLRVLALVIAAIPRTYD